VCVCCDLHQAGSFVTVGSEGAACDGGVIGELSIAGSLRTAGDLVTTGDVSGAGDMSIGRDLVVGGSLSTAGDLDVGGTLRVSGDFSHAGSSSARRAPYGAGAPSCGCNTFDVAGSVARAKSDNDNAKKNLPSDAAINGADEVVLTSGRYYFSRPSWVGRTHVKIEGNVSVFVDGSLDAVGESAIEVPAGSTLDLYVAGSVHAVGSLVAGACDPSAFRLYVGGAGSVIAGAGQTELRGFVFAPDAEVSIAGDTRITGAILARRISYAGELRVKHVPEKARPAEPSEREIAAPVVVR
jgi:hypothetical protein